MLYCLDFETEYFTLSVTGEEDWVRMMWANQCVWQEITFSRVTLAGVT